MQQASVCVGMASSGDTGLIPGINGSCSGEKNGQLTEDMFP